MDCTLPQTSLGSWRRNVIENATACLVAVFAPIASPATTETKCFCFSESGLYGSDCMGKGNGLGDGLGDGDGDGDGDGEGNGLGVGDGLGRGGLGRGVYLGFGSHHIFSKYVRS